VIRLIFSIFAPFQTLYDNVIGQISSYISTSFQGLQDIYATTSNTIQDKVENLLELANEISVTVEEFQRINNGREERLSRQIDHALKESISMEAANNEYVRDRDADTKKLCAEFVHRRRSIVGEGSQAIKGFLQDVKAPKLDQDRRMLHML
jgi:hypothetical protein